MTPAQTQISPPVITDVLKQSIQKILEHKLKDALDTMTGYPFCLIGPPVEGPSQMECEHMVSVQSRVNLCLVLRSRKRLCEILRPSEAQDMSACVCLAKETLKKIYEELLPGTEFSCIIKKTDPREWPRGKPQAEIVALVEKTPVELRVWLD